MENNLEEKRFDIGRWIIITGWLLSVLMGIAILGTILYLMIGERQVPEALIGWGGAAIGFVFGLIPGTIREFIGLKNP